MPEAGHGAADGNQPGVDGAAIPSHGRQHTGGHPGTDGPSRRLKASALRATPSAHLPSQPKTLRRTNLQKSQDLTKSGDPQADFTVFLSMCRPTFSPIAFQ